MLKTAGQPASSQPIELATDPKAREAGKQAPKRQAQDIHPSLRALPDYPE